MTRHVKYDLTKELQEAVHHLKEGFGLECTLSEVLYLRNCIQESIEANKKGKSFYASSSPMVDGVVALFKDYYEFDWWDLWGKFPAGHRKAREPIIGLVMSKLVADEEGFDIDQRFKEYLKRVQERQYYPFIQRLNL